MTISDLIKTLQTAKKHIGDVEVFVGNDVLGMAQIDGGPADMILPKELTDSEDFGRLFSSDETILKLG